MERIMADITPELRQEFTKTMEKKMGAKIEQFPPLHRELPTEIDLGKFGDFAPVAEGTIATLREIINTPVITDKYKHHSRRERARFNLYAQIEAKYGKEAAEEFNRQVVNNKLKRNRLANVLPSMNLYKEFLGELPQHAEIEKIVTTEIDALKTRNPKTGKIKVLNDPWSKRTIAEKRDTITRLTRLAVDAIWEIAEK